MELKKKIQILTLVFTLLPLLLLAIGLLGSAIVSTAPDVASTSQNPRLTNLVATMIYILTVIIISGFLNSPDLPKSIFSEHTPWQAGWRMALINAFPIFSFAYYIATGKIAFLAITAVAALIAVMIIRSRVVFDDEMEVGS